MGDVLTTPEFRWPEVGNVSTKYTIEVCKNRGELLGARVVRTQHLLVGKVLEGLIAEWNKQNPCTPVSTGDRIIAVNRVYNNTDAMFRTLMSSVGRLRITFLRPTVSLYTNSAFLPNYVVETTRTERGVWGISLGVNLNRHLMVYALKNGIISAWNAEHPLTPISVGDIVTKVNGRGGTPSQLLSALKAAEGPVQITLCRPTWNVQEDARSLLREMVSGLKQVSAEVACVDECVICLEDVSPEAMLTQLPCGHAFCIPCVQKWVTGFKAACPLCVAPICSVPESAKEEAIVDQEVDFFQEEMQDEDLCSNDAIVAAVRCSVLSATRFQGVGMRTSVR
eukprot:CAMPEP_0170592636 /NCGR_PEP_ID=MMETSP0224-20130122/13026_1 /TAXON_ID=285029 /ORGANISM="Togula jolla, Strain CCCM 725" /LENGTH=336 /DNA_ID=CAMNT_0010916547 /DNA_START=150 /DNA_END=1160 /DNA_ORIENTATION=-